MVTASVELARAMLEEGGGERRFTVFASRGRPAGMEAAAAGFVLSPHRHEVLNKLRWLPVVESQAGLEAILYPYWPSPPRRRRGAPPAAVFIHDVAFQVRPREVPWQQRLYLGSLLPNALRQAGAVLVPSESARRDVLDHYPIAGLEGRLAVVPEGTSLHGVEPGPLPDGLRPGFLLAVGTIEPRKNYPRLLVAYRALRREGGAPPLVVAGRIGWAFGAALHELRAEPGVILLGHVSDTTLAGLYRDAAALAFPSLYEGFGLQLLDAMAAGLPAVAGRAGSLPELAGDAALLVDPLDSEAIAGGLRQVLGDTGLRRRLASAGRRRAALYTWAKAACGTLSALDRIA